MSWGNRPVNWDAPGQPDLGEDRQKILDQIEFLTSPPMAELRRTTAFSIPNSSTTAIQFDSAVIDNYSGWVAGSPSRWTVPVAGIYLVSGLLSWASNATGLRTAEIGVNGTTVPGTQTRITPVSGSATAIPTLAKLITLAVNDYVELRSFQSSGGALNTDAALTDDYTSISICWKGSA